MANDQRSVGGRTSRIVIAGSIIAAFSSAAAEPRQKAPIRYGPAPNSQPYQIAHSGFAQRADFGTAMQLAGSSTTRTEFRYPDQPHVVYGDQRGPKPAVNDAPPMAFSSSTAAVSPEKATQLAAFEPPALNPTTSNSVGLPTKVAPKPLTGEAVILQPTDAVVLAPANRFESQRAGKPYKISNEWYTPEVDPHYDNVGTASWYGPNFHGKLTANGEIFDQEGMTAAHPTLPIPSLVQVINLENGREVVVRVNDRGPFIDNRIIDMSKRSAEVLGFKDAGRAQVRVRYLGPAPTLPEGIQTVAHKSAPKSKPTAPATLPSQPLTNTPALDGAAPDAQQDHYVQVGSFTDIANAQVQHDRFIGSYDVDIVSARVNGADFFRVMVGPVSSEIAAEELRNQIASKGLANGLVVAAR